MAIQICIIGGGIAGLTAAIAFRKKGIETLVFEAAPQLREIGAGIGLGANAIKAFRVLGIEQDIIELGRVLPAFSIRNHKGRQLTYTDSRRLSEKYGLDNFAIHRASLHTYLQSQLDPGTLHCGKKVTGIHPHKESITLFFEDGTSWQTRYLVVADGIHSLLRRKLIPGSEPRYSGYTCWRALIPESGIEPEHGFETWGPAGRFGVTPLKGELYWYACINAPRNSARYKAYTIQDLQRHFGSYHSPVPQLLACTPGDKLIWSDICDLEPVRHYAYGNMVFIGDAAHATTPNLGQGACQAIEDALILAEEWSRGAGADAFIRFEKRRLKRTRFIINNSRRIGSIAQLQNPLLIALRNTFMRMLPAAVSDRRFEKLYTVDF